MNYPVTQSTRTTPLLAIWFWRMTGPNMSERTIRIEVRRGDVLEVKSDVLVLKYAQALYGVDAQAAKALGRESRFPKPKAFELVDSSGALAPAHVLFVGVSGSVPRLPYREIRLFTSAALTYLARTYNTIERVTFTIHGPGYGLDEIEAFVSQVAGVGMRPGRTRYLNRSVTSELSSEMAAELHA
jgi:hypothetical protein